MKPPASPKPKPRPVGKRRPQKWQTERMTPKQSEALHRMSLKTPPA